MEDMSVLVVEDQWTGSMIYQKRPHYLHEVDWQTNVEIRIFIIPVY